VLAQVKRYIEEDTVEAGADDESTDSDEDY
jgi:hypothetical protein